MSTKSTTSYFKSSSCSGPFMLSKLLIDPFTLFILWLGTLRLPFFYWPFGIYSLISVYYLSPYGFTILVYPFSFSFFNFSFSSSTDFLRSSISFFNYTIVQSLLESSFLVTFQHESMKIFSTISLASCLNLNFYSKWAF